MILWTILLKDAVSVLKDGSYCLPADTAYFDCKTVDEEFIIKDFPVSEDVKKDIMPIPCYASFKVSKAVQDLGVRTIVSKAADILHSITFPLTEAVLIELWANESDILSAKDIDTEYVVRDALWKPGDIDNWKHETLKDMDKIAKSDFLKYTRANREYYNVECLLQLINDYQVLAIHEFSRFAGNYYKVSDKYVSDYLLPTFSGPIIFSEDGFPRIVDGISVKRLKKEDIVKIQYRNGMHGCYGSMTLQEVCNVCDRETIECFHELTKKRFDIKNPTDFKNMTVNEFLGVDDFIITPLGEGGIL